MDSWNDRYQLFEQQALKYAGKISVDDFSHHTYCSFKHHYFYGEVPKTGCTTVKKVLIQAEMGRQIEFEQAEFIHYREFTPFLKV